MESLPTDAPGAPFAGLQPTRRLRYRHPLYSLAYVTLDQGNGGILRDLSEEGASVQAVGALRAGQRVRLRFDLAAPKHTPGRIRVDVQGEVAWANASGQAGVRFQDLSRELRRQVNEWILGNLLASIAQASPVLGAGTTSPEDENLILSGSSRPAIAMPLASTGVALAAAGSDDVLLLDWLLARLSPRGLMRLVDCLVLSASVLLFFVVALVVAKSLPEWPIALGLVALVACVFAGIYRYLFRWFGSGTAGTWLVEIAMQELVAEQAHRQERPRFR